MTRVNVVKPDTLCNKHLMAEYREIPRLVKALETSLSRKGKVFDVSEIPDEYVLGPGHVKFFFDKFKFLHNRYIDLQQELLGRGFNLTPSNPGYFKSVPREFYGDYSPTDEAVAINVARIEVRMPKNPRYTLI